MKEKQILKFNKEQVQYLILFHIKKNPYITQRECGKLIGRAVSVVNQELACLEEAGLIQKKYHTSKTIFYYLTSLGEKRLADLQIKYLSSIIQTNEMVIKQFADFKTKLKEQNVRFILLLGEKQDINILDYFLVRIDNSLKIQACLTIKEDDSSKEIFEELNKKIAAYRYDGLVTTSRFFLDEKNKEGIDVIKEKIKIFVL